MTDTLPNINWAKWWPVAQQERRLRQQAESQRRRLLREVVGPRVAIRTAELGTQPLEVPWLSQIEPFGGPYAGLGMSNCGPDVLVMQGAWNNWLPTTREMMHVVAEEVRGGQPWYINTDTSLRQVMDEVPRMSNGAASAKLVRNLGDLYDSMDAGQPPCVLVQAGYLRPAEYDQTPGWIGTTQAPIQHWILLSGYDTGAPQGVGDIQSNDPLSWYTQGRVIYHGPSILQAMDAVGGVIGYTIAAPDPRGAPPDPLPDPDPTDPCADVRAALEAMTTDRNVNYTIKMGFETYLRAIEQAKRIARGTTDRLIQEALRHIISP